MDAFVKGALPATSIVLVVRHGYIAWESYYAGDRRSLRACHCMTKSVVSILVGMLMKNHQIKDMEDPMLSYLPDLSSGTLAPGVDKITIRHLLTMTSGFPDDGGVVTVFVKGYLAKPLKTPPGETFAYNGTNPVLLSIILTELTKQTAAEYAEAQLFKPLGIRDYAWRKEYLYSKGAAGLSLTSRDLAKIGYLYLNHGTWEGTAQIAPEWVSESTGAQARPSTYTLIFKGYGNARYGYLWWVSPVPHAYFMSGHDGQSVNALPDQDTVVVVTTEVPLIDTGPETSQRYVPIITDYIIPALN
jgi:CubicO group peptidase (beta-lactamase class C family)